MVCSQWLKRLFISHPGKRGQPSKRSYSEQVNQRVMRPAKFIGWTRTSHGSIMIPFVNVLKNYLRKLITNGTQIADN